MPLPAPLFASAAAADVPLPLVIPFGLLLLLIAVMPLTPPRVKHVWERFYPHVSVGLGLAVALYYFLRVEHGGLRVLGTVEEYFSFISLIGSLFVVAGGIHINIRGVSRPVSNVIFLFVGAMLANVIGTTGASMVMIRPWIRMNKYRITAFHIVFFIFIVSNVGGALTPIGDPPLFLGYLHGVPFFWLVERAAPAWALTLALLLGVFYVLDQKNFLRAPAPIRNETAHDPLVRVEGMHNVLFLGLIMVAVFLTDRYFVRELVMLGAAAASFVLTKPPVRAANEFTFLPIKEVGFLFVGIFLTMRPALDYLEVHGQEFGFQRPIHYYFAAGSLSAVLDNAPTYLNFLTLAESSVVPAEIKTAGDAAAAQVSVDDAARVREAVLIRWLLDEENLTASGARAFLFVVAVSLGSVFFGAMTYIGNGPNFMVKSIADSANIKTPTFFGYVFKYSLPILLPILAIVPWWFL